MKYATQQEKARFENIASMVGKSYGYKTVTVNIIKFAAFKLRWTRQYQTIDFNVSDYLCNAPDEVVADIFNRVFSKIAGNDDSEYSPETCKFFTDKHFSGARRRTFNARNGIEPAKFKTFKGVPVHYYKHPSAKAGGTSTLMRVIAINPALKGESEDVIENIIKYEYNVLQNGLATFQKEPETVEYDKRIVSKYPL